MHSILVKDYMDQNPNAIASTATLREVIALLMKAQLTGVPVIDENKNLVGFVSEQDCIKEMLNNTFYCEEPAAVTEVMSHELKTVSPDTSIVEIAERMAKNPPKNYPVCENGKLVGVISRRLILKALLDNDEDCYIRV